MALRVPLAAAHGEECSQTPSSAVLAAREIVARAPQAIDTRLSFSELLIDASCYAEAVAVLEQGLEAHPGNSELQKRLRFARAFLDESRHAERAPAGWTQISAAAQREHDLVRCSRLGDLGACDRALTGAPGDAVLLEAAGDALARSGRPVAAGAAYSRGAALAPREAAFRDKMQLMQRKRAELATACLAGNEPLARCEAALQSGASDEFDLRKRIAILALRNNESVRALREFLAAFALRADDEEVARAIVDLVDRTGTTEPAALDASRAARARLEQGSGERARSPGTKVASTTTRPAVKAVARVQDRSRYSNVQPKTRSN